jgi:hypothetical protein
MVGVVVDGPVGEHHVGLFPLQQFAELGVTGRIHDGMAVDLLGEHRGGP